jgi:hypothetical protein
MQKLYLPFRNPKNTNDLFFSLPLKNPTKTLLSKTFKTLTKTTTRSPLLSMPTTIFPNPTSPSSSSSSSAFRASLSSKPFTTTTTSTISSRFFVSRKSRNCCICRCGNDKRQPSRAWVVLKDGMSCTGAAWTHTRADGSVLASAAADKGSESVDEDEGEMGLEEKPSRLSSGSRRQRGGGGGGGGGGVV